MTAYATEADMARLGIQVAATKNTPSFDINAVLESASRFVDSYLSDRYVTPFTTWTDDLRGAVCDIAAYRILRVRGFNPEGPDKLVVDAYDRAMKWIMDVASGKASVGGAAPVESSVPLSDFVVISSPPRGWSR